MEAEKLQINLGAGVTKAEVILREGAAIKELEPKAPIKTKLSGVIGAPVEYLTKRVATGQKLHVNLTIKQKLKLEK